MGDAVTVTKPTTEIAITIPPNRSKEERGVAVEMASGVKAETWTKIVEATQEGSLKDYQVTKFESTTIPATIPAGGGDYDVLFRLEVETRAAAPLFVAWQYRVTLGDAVGDAVEVTELMRKFNAGYAGNQGPADLSATVDGYINIGGYLTLPAQDFTYGGGNQGPGENGYQGAAKTRSVWAQGITSAMVDAATWMTEEERAELKRAIGSYTVPHAMYRLSPSRTIMAVDSPWIHMSYAETQFLLAETTIRGWGIDTETAESRFAKGYEAAVKQFSLFGVSAADMPSDEEIQDYMTTYLLPEVAAGGTRALEEINKQIWILHFMDPIEAWSNLRRTNGMPTAYCKWYNRYPSENQSNGLRPLRLTYPIEEQSKNTVNWQEAVDRMGGSDDWTVPVWWDVQNAQ